MAAEKLTKKRLIQILIMLGILVFLFFIVLIPMAKSAVFFRSILNKKGTFQNVPLQYVVIIYC